MTVDERGKPGDVGLAHFIRMQADGPEAAGHAARVPELLREPREAPAEERPPGKRIAYQADLAFRPQRFQRVLVHPVRGCHPRLRREVFFLKEPEAVLDAAFLLFKRKAHELAHAVHGYDA